MVDLEELKKINFMQDFSPEMLIKLAELATIKEFNAGSILFRRNNKLEFFHMLLSGQVALIVVPSPEVALSLGIVHPGYSFGVSAFIPEAKSSATAICIEDCRVISLPGKEIINLFEQNGELGYEFMLRLVEIFKSRMNQRTELFLQSLERHPEIKEAFKKNNIQINQD